MKAHTDLSGRWTGRYDYQGALSPVAFEAVLDDQDGHLVGTITEPNSFASGQGPHLQASLKGNRLGSSVSFTKYYHGFDQGDDPIYDGDANAALTRISGQWRFATLPGWCGRFVMVRAPEAQARRRKAKVESIEV